MSVFTVTGTKGLYIIALYEIHEATWSIQCVRHRWWYRIAFYSQKSWLLCILESNTLYSYGAVFRRRLFGALADSAGKKRNPWL